MAYKQFSTIMSMWNAHALKTNAVLAKSFYKCMSSSASANKSLNVGFVGLGNMGARMANNLIKKVIQLPQPQRNSLCVVVFFSIQFPSK